MPAVPVGEGVPVAVEEAAEEQAARFTAPKGVWHARGSVTQHKTGPAKVFP